MTYNHKGFIFKVDIERLPSLEGYCVKMYVPRKYWFPLFVWEEFVAVCDIDKEGEVFDSIISEYNNNMGDLVTK